MKKRILSLLLALMMLISAAPAGAESGENNITVYLSMSRYGEVINTADGAPMAYLPVNLSGGAEYNLDDVFAAAHAQYYTDGAAGYASSESEFGQGIDKLWGDESGNFGYQVNGGTETVSGLTHIVEHGDFIDACIYKNLFPDTEGYARFNLTQAEVFSGEAIELTLSYVSGYDESWNTVFSPCEGAVITIDGVETELTTDADGKASITAEGTGSHVISATKTKLLGDEEVPAITAPVCVVTVNANPGAEAVDAVEIIHNIAARYKASTLTADDGNLPWIIADMAVYEELFPDSEGYLTDSEKSELLTGLVAVTEDAEKPGDIAKVILALRALGYDASDVYTKNYKKINMPEKLTNLIKNGDSAVTNIYTLPYVIIALAQGEDYATEEERAQLIAAALESKEQWQATDNGTDAMTPMLLALAPYYDTDDGIKAVIDEAIDILKAEQRTDGLIDGFEGYESASTGLAICALSALGIDAESVTNGGGNLIDGLISTANEDLNGFPNAFATEQGFRGLLAWQLLSSGSGKAMYDFSDYPMEPADLSGAVYLPVIFDVDPENTRVTIEGAEEIEENCFDLDEGTYTYTASASGYKTETDTFKITARELEERVPLTIKISLSKKSSEKGGSSSSDTSFRSGTGIQSVTIPAADNVEEGVASITTPLEDIFPDISAEDWYYTAVKFVYENNLFNGTGAGFEPNTPMSRAMLVTVLHRLSHSAQGGEENPFTDVHGDAWYAEGVKWAAENKIVTGVTPTEFMPDTPVTREQLAVILYRYATFCGYDTTISESASLLGFSDYEEISPYAAEAMQFAAAAGIMNGRADGSIAPRDGATRAEVAAMLMRFAGVYTK